jgi:hypothetical protein
MITLFGIIYISKLPLSFSNSIEMPKSKFKKQTICSRHGNIMVNFVRLRPVCVYLCFLLPIIHHISHPNYTDTQHVTFKGTSHNFSTHVPCLQRHILPHLSAIKDPHYSMSTQQTLSSKLHIALHQSTVTTHQQINTEKIIPSNHKK